MKKKEQIKAAKEFSERWLAKEGYEKGETVLFWESLLRNVYGIKNTDDYIVPEDRSCVEGSQRFIDITLPATRVMIEQKGSHVDLTKPEHQSGTQEKLTPFQQAYRYVLGKGVSEHPKWIVVCNFRTFHIHDMERPNDPPQILSLKNLPDEVHRLRFLVDEKSEHVQEEEPVSVQAGKLVGELYDKLLVQYGPRITDDDLRSLNILCVRMVFCLYAEDSGVFNKEDQFHDYLSLYKAEEMRDALVRLFKMLNTPYDRRSKFERKELLDFPYVNGGLFDDGEDTNEIPQLTDEIRTLLLDKVSYGFNWSYISPTVFGAVFENTLNPKERRKGGMHYTSVANIHKVIDNLFLDELKGELEEIKTEQNIKKRDKQLVAYQEKLAGITCLDPACGSGNFLTETYLSLRRLENEVIEMLYRGHKLIGEFLNPIRVSINQFYGIEINEFAVSVATTAMWIAESQMRQETENIVSLPDEFLPLTSNAGIRQGNALRQEWEKVVKPSELKYIFGNPPFVGARKKDSVQKDDIDHVFGKKWKGRGDMDYVCCWFKKAADYMKDTDIRAAFVSTNSISQGIQVSLLWEYLVKQGMKIDFAYRPFLWDSEANVYCVIEGFSYAPYKSVPIIYDEEGKPNKSEHINAYLLDMEDVFIQRRKNSLCESPEIGIGNKPIDDSNYLFTEGEKEEFIKKEPRSEKFFRLWYGSDEFINQKPRHCLWLGECLPLQLQSMPHCMKRVEAVRQFRLNSSDKGTRKLAERPTRFHVENMFKGSYCVIPATFSEKRDYVTIGFVKNKSLCSNALFLLREPSWYHFGILTSSVHKVWTYIVAGRLKQDIRYSKDLVYNNYPWPKLDEYDTLMATIKKCAVDIESIRKKYFEQGENYKSLYKKETMPEELKKAHSLLDKAVLKAYGLKPGLSDLEIAKSLLQMNKELVELERKSKTKKKKNKE